MATSKVDSWEKVSLADAKDLNGALASGAEAATHVAYGFSDLVVLQPFVDSQASNSLGTVATQWRSAERANGFGNVPQVVKLDNGECTGVQVTNFFDSEDEESDGGRVASVLTGSGLLLKMLPNLYKIASQKQPCVFHVSALKTNSKGTSVESDLSDIAALRETGIPILSGTSPQEIHDLGVIAHVAALKTSAPVINVWDGSRLSNGVSAVKLLDFESMSNLVTAGVANGDVADVLDHVMNNCASTLKRRYNFFEYTGPEDAQAVIVAMGTSARVLTEFIRAKLANKLSTEKEKIGVLTVRVLRPWSTRRFLSSLPKTTRRVCVVDQNRSGENDTPLFKDIATAFHSDAQWGAPELFSANIVVNNKSGFTPSICRALFENVSSQKPKARFTLSDLAIKDLRSLEGCATPQLTFQGVNWTLGDRQKDSRNALSVVVGPFLSLHVQQNDSSSSKTNVSRSDIRVSTFDITSEYPIIAADVIVVDDPSIFLLPHCDVLAQAKVGAKLVVNAPWTTVEQADLELDSAFKAHLAAKKIELYAIDATKLARSFSNWVMQAVLARMATLPFMDFKQIFSSFGALLLKNVPAAAHLCHEISDQNIDSHIHRISYKQDTWAALVKPDSNPRQAAFIASVAGSEDFVPFDMVPEDVLSNPVSSGDDSNLSASVPLYYNLLSQLFGDRAVVADTTGGSVPKGLESEDASSVRQSLESCYGAYLVKAQARKRLVELVGQVISNSASAVSFSKELIAALGMWHGCHDSAARCAKVVPRLVELLAAEKGKSAELEYIYNNRSLLHKSSKWIIGGDNWAYDLSNSGIRHLISSGEDVNVLLFDTQLYAALAESEGFHSVPSSPAPQDLNTSAMSLISTLSGVKNQASTVADGKVSKRKKDIGLYAMNYGSAYVASVSVLASQSQALRALSEADSFQGPSIILAHAPHLSQIIEKSGVEVQVATDAVESGHWPLYRYNPARENEEFTLDSSKIKEEIQEFVNREQNLSLLASAKPQLPNEMSESLESSLESKDAELRRRAEQRRLNEQFDQLVDGVSGGGNRDLGLVVLYGSDSGNAAGVAEKLAKKVEVSGCGEVRCMEANDFNVDNLSEEKHIVLVLATAGQGEPCSNAKGFVETLLKYPNKVPGLKFAVFGLGDSHYWGEGTNDSAKYFCLNARQVDEKLAALGAERLISCGLGDDQDDDGYEGALGEWETSLWSALEVTIKGGDVGGAPQIIDDDIKIKSNFLRGMIDEGLADLSTGKLLPEDTKLTKFHGIYQQDLRSVRDELDAKGLERAYSFMIRAGLPGGVGTCEQYIGMDEICSKYANGALKLTTRQAFQLHGVVKKELKTTMKAINRACLDTLAACGDVNRNVIANPHHLMSPAHKQVSQLALDLQAHLRPRTTAYAEIWLDKKPVGGSVDHEPIYGVTYLPRKFKIAIAIPPLNDVDVFAHCLGYIAIIKNGKLEGYNVCVGGGMGTTHGNKATYPRLSDVMGFCTPEQACLVAEAVVVVQRDHGERENRKHARLKYTVEDMGVDVFRSKVEEYCKFKLGKAVPFKFDTNADPYGWAKNADGTWQYTLFVENGYVKDRPGYAIKTALREIAEFHTGGEMSLTATQNIIIGKISQERKPQIEAMMAKYGIDNKLYSAMRLHSMACVALPTCALAMAESQTYLPSLITKLETVLDEVGLRHDAITIRMTGCPNGCGRPTLAEIGFIGKAPGQYNLYLGGGFAGNRISKMYKEGVNEEQILEILYPMFRSYAAKRHDGERFGDFCIRTGIIEPTMQGRFFWSTGSENQLVTATGSSSTQIYW